MSKNNDETVLYSFEGYRLDPSRGTLEGPDGEERPLRPKSFALLQHLLDHPGRLQSRDELFAALWPGVIVSDDSLTQCVSELRRAFGTDADRIIRTRPRRGYVVVADVTSHSGGGRTEQAPPAHLSTPRSFEPLLRRTAFVFVEKPAPEQDAASAAIQVLGLELARYEDLTVRRTETDEVMDYRMTIEDLNAYGDGARQIVLEDAHTGSVVWTHRFNLPQHPSNGTGNALAELANLVARQIAVASRRAAREKRRDDLSARELCLLASDHHQRGAEADTLIAHELLERAIMLDPGYSQAYAWHAYTVQRGFSHGWGPVKGDAARSRAIELARKAVSLSPYSPLCLSRLSYCLMLQGHWGEAVDTARLALTGPYAAGINVRVTASEVLSQAGFAHEAISVMEIAVKLDPYASPTVFSVLGRCLLMDGRPRDALPHLRLCAARLPDYGPCHHSLLLAAHEAEEPKEASLAWREIQRLQPGWTPTPGAGPWQFRKPEDQQRMQAAVLAQTSR